MWKADVVETWIVDKEAYVSTDDFGRDLSSVQTLLTKQETFDIGLEAFENEGIQNITALKDNLVASGHNQSAAINKKYEEVRERCFSARWPGDEIWFRFCLLIVSERMWRVFLQNCV